MFKNRIINPSYQFWDFPQKWKFRLKNESLEISRNSAYIYLNENQTEFSENSSDYDEDDSNCGDRIESMMPNDDDMMDIMQTVNDDIGHEEDITAAPDFNTYDNDII